MGVPVPPYEIIRKRADFLSANRGKRFVTPGFVMLVYDRRDDTPTKRLGITITKKVGNAVIRNRMKRRFRALAREYLGEMGKPGADHILIGRVSGIELDFGVLRQDIQRALKKLSNTNRSPEPVEGRVDGKRRSPSVASGSTGSGLRLKVDRLKDGKGGAE
jgi:ribonuclease P protein component